MLSIAGYQFKELLYQSPKTQIYRALRNNDQKTVIIKLPTDELSIQKNTVDFQREIELTQLAAHDNIIQYLGAEKIPFGLVLIIEDFGAVSLKQIIKQKLPIKKLLQIAIDITKGLGNIHEKRIIFKDLNSNNIVVHPTTLKTKIIDFGLATRLSAEKQGLSQLKMLNGTLDYISPEQTGRVNRLVTYKSDFYSLGVTFYEMFAGSLPFTAQDEMELIHNHIAKKPISPKTLNPNIPTVLAEIILKLLAKNAEERYQSAFGILHDLEKCLAQLNSGETAPKFNIAENDVATTFQIPEKLYGRQQQVKELLAAFERECNLESNTELVLVAGYSGIGKSALVAEIHKPVIRERGYFISGKFDQYQVNVPYSAILQAFRGLIKQILSEDARSIAEWIDKIKAVVGANGQLLVDVLPELELLIGKQEPIQELTGSAARNRFNVLFKDFICLFADSSHPLVLFIDDLQWADLATLTLIEAVMSDTQLKHFMLIGAYRDNEVHTAHPLILTIERISQVKGAFVNTITLRPLANNDIVELVQDTLLCTQEQAKPLAEMLLQKTGGNPFFINQFLKNLYEENLITLNTTTGKWLWDIDKIRKKNLTDNVVDLMIGKIRKLSLPLQEFLKIATCIGNTFEINFLKNLASINTQTATIDAIVLEAVEAGILLPDNYQNPNFCKFAHDRIQQAIYQIATKEEKTNYHCQIALQLLQDNQLSLENLGKGNFEAVVGTSAGNSYENKLDSIFEMVNQLNESHTLLLPSYQKAIAEMNYVAAKKAKESNAYDTARKYIDIALALLPNNSWQENEVSYHLTVNFYCLAAEIYAFLGNSSRTDELVELVLSKSNNLLEKIYVYEIKIQILGSLNRMLDAIATAREVLALLGVKLPKQAGQADIVMGLMAVKFQLIGKTPESLINLPTMTDKLQLAAMRILISTTSSAFLAMPNMFPVIIFNLMKLAIKHGNSQYSSYAYATFGLIACAALNDIDTGYRFGRLSEKVAEKYDAEVFRAKLSFVTNAAVNHWKNSFASTIEPFLRGFQSGMNTGDLEYGAWNGFFYCFTPLFMGENLESVKEKFDKLCPHIAELKLAQVLTVITLWQEFTNVLLSSKTAGELVLWLEADQDRISSYQSRSDTTALNEWFLFKTILFVLIRQYDKAAESSLECEKYLQSVVGLSFVPYYHFYSTLAFLNADAKKYSSKINKNIKLLKNWAKFSPANYEHKYLLCLAEQARMEGKNLIATDFYEQAIEKATQNAFLNEKCIAEELAAHFYLSVGKTHFSQLLFRQAYNTSIAWGAVLKQEYLKSQHQDISRTNETVSVKSKLTNKSFSKHNISLHNEAINHNFDVSSMLKSSVALSGELNVIGLLQKMMAILLENSGADKGAFVMYANGNFVLEAQMSLENTQAEVQQQQIVTKENAILPLSILHYVARSKQSLLLGNATQSTQYSEDIYIKHHKSQSILCVPIINKGNLTGLIYLENNLGADVFDADKLQAITLLSSQIGISYDNAILYETLEAKIEERTLHINKQKEEIEHKSLEITASINYAKRIQRAMLPTLESIKNVFPDTFILYKPRDIVSGDSYWFAEKDNKAFIAAIDCTGHGVPGALVSMVADGLLKQLVDYRGLTMPNEVLSKLHRRVRSAFRQDTTMNKDGMDLALCCIDKNTKMIQYSGAMNPIYYVQNNTFIEVKATKQPIGGMEENRAYELHTIDISQPTMLYLLSDGYQDQFGGEQNRKFMVRKLKELLFQIHEKPVAQQEEILENTLVTWMGDKKQTDDILVIGMQIAV